MCSDRCALICVLSHVCSHMCAFICVIFCALICGLSWYCVLFPIPPTKLFGVSCQDNSFGYIGSCLCPATSAWILRSLFIFCPEKTCHPYVLEALVRHSTMVTMARLFREFEAKVGLEDLPEAVWDGVTSPGRAMQPRHAGFWSNLCKI